MACLKALHIFQDAHVGLEEELAHTSEQVASKHGLHPSKRATLRRVVARARAHERINQARVSLFAAVAHAQARSSGT